MLPFGDYRQGQVSPPPPSTRPRPWSPVADYDSLPRHLDHYLAHDSWNNRNQYRRQREPSEVSVEALDLADYAQTLRRAPERDPYPSYDRPLLEPPTVDRQSLDRHSPLSRHDSPYPPFVPSDRAFSAQSHDTIRPPPSLVSAGATSHSSHADSSYHLRRPLSLPSRGPAIFNATAPHHSLGRDAVPDSVRIREQDGDLSNFPGWARDWYREPARPKLKDPLFPTPFHAQPFDANSASARERDYLPWSQQAGEYDPHGTLPPEVKEERIRMLEREFAGDAKGKGKDDVGEEGIVGSVDEKGRLITDGPKKRATVRWLQAILALGAAVSSLYAALIVKPPTPAPPASKPPAFALYILSCLTLLIMFYLFAIRPCFRRAPKDDQNPLGPSGMLVLPIQGSGGKKGKKKGKKGKKGGEQGDVQVNLIVDPNLFGSARGHRDDSDDSNSDPEASRSSRRRNRDGGAPRRRSVFAGLALESKWKRARSSLKKMLIFDIIWMFLWGGVFVLVLLGQRCPAGTFQGWCDGYNVATAASCLLCVAYGMSVFFDIKDLHASRQSPRTRT